MGNLDVVKQLASRRIDVRFRGNLQHYIVKIVTDFAGVIGLVGKDASAFSSPPESGFFERLDGVGVSACFSS